MSGIIGVFDDGGAPVTDAALAPMLAAMRQRGSERVGVWRDGGATLAAARSEWEQDLGFSNGALVVADDDLVVAADASIYYRADLVRRLERERGIHAHGWSASDLILAAYRAWGRACAERLEGDFTYIVWNRRTRELSCARDFGGKRPLYHADIGGTMVVASTMGAILAHPRCPSELNLAVIAADAAGLFAAAHDTAYRAIALLPAGWSLIKSAGAAVRTERHWSPPPIESRRAAPFETAAEELRETLSRAVGERLAGAGPTSVWMSGGWDSTAVFGSANHVLRARPGDAAGDADLHAVSIGFPQGDPGREDELIADVATHCGRPIHWLDIGAIPLLERPAERAAAREAPFAHAFEMGNRALSAGSRAVNARVALDGVGGDQLFQVSEIFLADLLRTGRWTTLAREWRLKGMSGSGFRNFFRWAVQPALPSPLHALATALRGGRRLRGHLERVAPPWMDERFMRAHGLVERERAHAPAPVERGSAAYETRWYLSHPYFPRAFSAVAGFALESGVELRSPLMDRRVIELALSRPREERSQGRETKRLLRRAMQGLLPEHVLAPRTHRTGVTSGYFGRAMRETHGEEIQSLLDGRMILVELGMINAEALRHSWAAYRRSGGEAGVNLFLTIQAELWVRAHGAPPRESTL